MEPSKEICQLIVKHTSQRSDLCVLARVSKLFQDAAERALYNTVYMQDPEETIALCDVISTRYGLPTFVMALTVTTHNGDVPLPEKYWPSLAGVLKKTIRLRSLIFHIDGNTDQAWILRDCTFQLQTFHCDLSWDADLVTFLNTQTDMLDLYISDYRPPTTYTPSVDLQALPRLATIESNYNEGVRDLVPGRPVLRVKTCFSCESDAEKKEELLALTAALMRSKRSLVSLDLADATYTEKFSLVVLQEVSRSLPHLRYLGTIVLPVGTERLQLFGMLMRFRRLSTTEVEVSEWEPAPGPHGLRALANELRLYCPSITCIVFVQDFERTVVNVVDGRCIVDETASAEHLWRDV